MPHPSSHSQWEQGCKARLCGSRVALSFNCYQIGSSVHWSDNFVIFALLHINLKITLGVGVFLFLLYRWTSWGLQIWLAKCHKASDRTGAQTQSQLTTKPELITTMLQVLPSSQNQGHGLKGGAIHLFPSWIHVQNPPHISFPEFSWRLLSSYFWPGSPWKNS